MNFLKVLLKPRDIYGETVELNCRCRNCLGSVAAAIYVLPS